MVNKFLCDFRFLLLAAAVAFIYIQMRLFTTQSEYADRLATAVEAETRCTSQMRKLIDQISMQQSRIVDLEVKGLQRWMDKLQTHVAAVVIMACNRDDYLERTIKSILTQDTLYQNAVASKYPLFVSQDGSDPQVRKKALSYDQVTYMQHLDSKPVQTERPGELIAYYKIARHYKWALDELFYKHNFSRVIILEDDKEIAPDFFDYFEAAAALMEKDKTIMVVSSWNDNGQKQFVHDSEILYRSDFFPGLGWMLTKPTWNELSPKLQENHKGRQFIRPEVCRTYNFGDHGSSLGQFFRQYLEPIKLNDVQVDWKSKDLSYLMEDKYIKHFVEILKNAKPIYGADAVLKASNQSDFERIARQFGVFQEWKDGVPRTAYKGVVVFRYPPPRRVFLVGLKSFKLLGIKGV
ncbi:hypothetical protein BT93_G1258 [Corymbia citriodora subsp. variegata]|nr:hypothetical protein BT93_G1258 [Corymbia citriodora subsp. variegata]